MVQLANRLQQKDGQNGENPANLQAVWNWNDQVAGRIQLFFLCGLHGGKNSSMRPARRPLL